jgi:hypothetical protein
MIDNYINLPAPNIQQSEWYKPEKVDAYEKKVECYPVHGSVFWCLKSKRKIRESYFRRKIIRCLIGFKP